MGNVNKLFWRVCKDKIFSIKQGMIGGKREWRVDGKLHRVDGPAVERINGDKEWWFNGKRHREDGPVEDSDNYKEWWINGKRHREDGPAIDWIHGTREWYLNGKRHRLDGPATEWVHGDKEWWINGTQFTCMEFHHRFINEMKDQVWQLCTYKMVADPMFAEYFLKFLL
jgi:hypothetical protein